MPSIALSTVDPPDLVSAARAAQTAGRLAEAARLYGAQLESDPNHQDALHLLAGLALQLEQLPLAEQLIRRLLPLAPTFSGVHYNLLTLLRRQHKTAAAYEAASLALELVPNHPDLLCQAATILLDDQQWAAAATQFAALCQRYPIHGELWHGLAIARYRLAELPDALIALHQARQLLGGRDDLRNTEAQILQSAGDRQTARAIWQALHTANPRFKTYAQNLGLLLMYEGEWHAGFTAFAQRLDLAALYPALPVWQPGMPLAGKQLVIHAEQGLGDYLQFLQLLPLLAATGAVPKVFCPPTLLALARRSFPTIEFMPLGAPCPPAHAQTTLLNLPLLLGLTGPAALPPARPYLQADPARIARWQQRLATLPRPLTGLVWAGNPQHPHDNLRSIPWPLLAENLYGKIPGTLLSLQQSNPASPYAPPALLASLAPHFPQLGDELTDYDDTAALLLALDQLVTIDTSIAHAAGALGVPTHLLIHHCPHWCWHGGGSQSPWYRDLTLYRQPRPHDWATPIAQLTTTLSNRHG